MWDRKNAKYKDHVTHKKQKATKIEESYICIQCLEVYLTLSQTVFFELFNGGGENFLACGRKITIKPVLFIENP